MLISSLSFSRKAVRTVTIATVTKTVTQTSPKTANADIGLGRHLCAQCPPGAAITNRTEASNYCCPQRRTVSQVFMSTSTRFRLTKGTRTISRTATVTKTRGFPIVGCQDRGLEVKVVI